MRGMEIKKIKKMVARLLPGSLCPISFIKISLVAMGQRPHREIMTVTTKRASGATERALEPADRA